MAADEGTKGFAAALRQIADDLETGRMRVDQGFSGILSEEWIYSPGFDEPSHENVTVFIKGERPPPEP